MKVRLCECMECKERFSWRVEKGYKGHMVNISGEKTIYCPKCKRSSVRSGPIKEVDSM